MRDERGAAMVLVAVTLPVLVLFMAFGIEVGHWYDYSRNLQNRADAAALAAAVHTEESASAPPLPPDRYHRPGRAAVRRPAGRHACANLPYRRSMTAGASTTRTSRTSRRDAANYHVLLNSPQYWNTGGTNWSMGSHRKAVDHAGTSSLALCSSTDEDGNTGAMMDVRVTQSNLGLFFPFFGFTPTISAHARVGLQGVGAENNIIPLAVRDPAEERCVEANFFNGSTQIASVPLNKVGTDPNTGAVQWDNSSAPVSVSIPSGSNVYEQIVTGYATRTRAPTTPAAVSSTSTAGRRRRRPPARRRRSRTAARR